MFSRTAKYAIMALTELAAGDRSLKIRELAQAAEIPQPFLAKLVPPLVQAGIITSTRGKRGGLAFAHPPEEVSLAEAIRAVEGDRLMLDCPFSLTPCRGQEDCPLASLWDPVRQRVVAFLEATSLAQVAQRRKR
ncbi:MAG: Rrf2 family transcriptional regulator [Candidatus Bipolaricaulis sp.]|jgi:Rrf2 family protein|nr:Rrf2 family transcriptional regulator [Candidatus Bipolaricaulis sp.]